MDELSSHSRPDLVRVAAGRTTITPTSPLVLAANGHPATVYRSVVDQLEASAFVIGEEADRVVLVTADLLYFGQALVDAVLEALRGIVDEDRILCFASHTHNAPATDYSKPLLGQPDDRYVAEVGRRLGALVTSLAHSPGVYCRVRVGEGASARSVGRRVFRPIVVRRGGLGFARSVPGCNRRTWTDRHVTTVRFEDATSGTTVGALWNYACHPVGHPDPLRVSAHFPGVVRAGLRARLGLADAPVGYVQGFSGDCRPLDRTTCRSSRPRWLTPIRAPGYDKFTAEAYQLWTRRLSADVLATFASDRPLSVGSSVRTHSVSAPRSMVLEGSLSDSDVRFAGVAFGDDVMIAGVSAEVVGWYARWLRRAASYRFAMIGGCMDDVVGYCPTSRMLWTGGYEAVDFCKSFSAVRVSPSVQECVQTGLTEVLRGLEAVH